MAFSYEPNGVSSMSLSEYVDFIASNIDIYDQESLKESAPALHALSLNRRLFDPIILEEIKSSALSGGVQTGNNYSDATFILARKTNSFFVRANVWRKPQLTAIVDYERQLYSYEEPHDHNFDFLTVGYYGPGYTTRIYEYDNRALVGRVGEGVTFSFLEETNLPAGKVMMYRKSLDVHTQLPPSATSISLNLMIPPRDVDYKDQFYFDMGSRTVDRFVKGRSDYQVAIINLAGEISGSNALDPLVSIARDHPVGRVRAAAISSALKIDHELSERLETLCGADQSPLVKDALKLTDKT